MSDFSDLLDYIEAVMTHETVIDGIEGYWLD